MTELTGAPESQPTKRIGGRIWQKIWPYLLVLLFGAILTMGVWACGLQVMTGDDYAFHVTRIQSASRAWSNGQILPQVDPDTLNGFGYAYNLFYGPLITYVISGIQVLVGLWPVAINIGLTLCLIGAGMTMCHTMLKISKNRALSVLVAVFYMASPYLLNNLYSRMALGEVVAAVAGPILLLGLYQLLIRDKHSARNIAISAALLVLSHSLSAMLFAMMAALFVIFNWRKVINWENLWRMVLGVVVALGLTAFFTLPLVEAKMVGIYGVFDKGYSEVYFGANPQSMNDHRAWPQQLLALEQPNKVNGDGLAGEYGITLGIIGLIGIFGFWFARRGIEDENQRRFLTSIYVIALIAILATLPIVDWYYMPGILWQMQFPWRMLMVPALLLSVVSGYTIFSLVRKATSEKQAVAMVVASLLAIYFVMPKILPNPEHHLDNVEDVREDPVVVGWESEYAPMQLLCSPDVEEDRKQGYACSLSRVPERLEERGSGLEVISGKLKLGRMKKDGLKVEFSVENETDEEAVVELPLIYYPGYEAKLGDETLKVAHSEENGLVAVTVPAKTQGEVKVKYGLSKATKIGLMVSAGTAGLGVIWLVISGIMSLRSRKKDAEMVALMDSVREVVERDEVKHEKTNKNNKKKAQPEMVSEALPLPMPPELPDDGDGDDEGGIEDEAEEVKEPAKEKLATQPKRRGRPRKKPEEQKDESADKNESKASKITSASEAISAPKVTKVRAKSHSRKDPE